MPHTPGSTLKPLVKLPKDPAGCWDWIGATDASGRAHKTVGGKSMSGQCWMWAQLFGPIPKGMVVYLTCGNRKCISPHHLRCGYQAEANRQGPNVTLTPEDVRTLRSIPVEDRTSHRAKTEAMQLGVNPQAIRDVWRGSTWGRGRPNNGPRHKAA